MGGVGAGWLGCLLPFPCSSASCESFQEIKPPIEEDTDEDEDGVKDL
jgi:hypothetical protein